MTHNPDNQITRSGTGNRYLTIPYRYWWHCASALEPLRELCEALCAERSVRGAAGHIGCRVSESISIPASTKVFMTLNSIPSTWTAVGIRRKLGSYLSNPRNCSGQSFVYYCSGAKTAICSTCTRGSSNSRWTLISLLPALCKEGKPISRAVAEQRLSEKLDRNLTEDIAPLLPAGIQFNLGLTRISLPKRLRASSKILFNKNEQW